MKRAGFLFLSAFVLVLSSCNTDYYLAKTFVKEVPKPGVAVKAPEKIFMVSYQETKADTAGLAEWQIDSIRYYESKILKNLSFDTLKHKFTTAFTHQIKALGFNVYDGEKLKAVLKNDSLHPVVVQFPQMELEEMTAIFDDKAFIGDRIFYNHFDVTRINLNTWLYLSRINHEGTDAFFITDSITDVIDGYYYKNYDEGKVKYRYKRHNLKVHDVYRFMEDMGRNYAQYVFDFYMNRYVRLNSEDGKKPAEYHYDPYAGKVIKTNPIPWVPLEKR